VPGSERETPKEKRRCPFMVMVKATKDSEPAIGPEEMLSAMAKFNEEMGKPA